MARAVRLKELETGKASTIWLSFDLGIRGDYESLYAWLDSHSAKECGDSLAVFNFSWKEDLFKELRADLTDAVKIDKRTRIYVIYRDRAAEKNRGKFIIGGRRASAWEGYSQQAPGEVDEEI